MTTFVNIVQRFQNTKGSAELKSMSVYTNVWGYALHKRMHFYRCKHRRVRLNLVHTKST